MMEYKGYVSKVEYDDTTGLLHGSVMNSGPYPIIVRRVTWRPSRGNFIYRLTNILLRVAKMGLSRRSHSQEI